MNRILIVAVRYPPCELIGAKRPYKMAKFLVDAGWEVTVLTVDPTLTPPVGVLEAGIDGIEVIRTKPFVPYEMLRIKFQNDRDTSSKPAPSPSDSVGASTGNEIKRYTKHLGRVILTLFDDIDEWSGWRRSALAAMKNKRKKFDIVLSTIPPFSTARLGRELAAYYECKFVLDYRDPWGDMFQYMHSIGQCSARKLRRQIASEDECLNAADLVLSVSPAITDSLRSRVAGKVLTVPQGFTGHIGKQDYDRESKYLLYAGTLSYGRDVSCVLSALKLYSKCYEEKLRLVYCGMHSDLAHQQAASVGAVEFIDVKGIVAQSEVLEYAKRALCNIVIVSSGFEYSYPGKLFELITAGRPIYVISSTISEAGKLVENYGLGISLAGQTVADLTKRIRKETDTQFNYSSKVKDLRAENIYTRMVKDGLQSL